MPDCLIGLGSNEGDRAALLAQAVARLEQSPDIAVRAKSAPHQTCAVGGPQGQPAFLNAAVRAHTSLSPQALMENLLEIERQLGRVRAERWGPRRIDLDLLLYGDRSIDSPALKVPHPRMAWRRFVLAPAAEVASSMVHPLIGWSVRQLLDHLDGELPYVALAGLPGLGKSNLAARLAKAEEGRLLLDPAAPLDQSPHVPGDTEALELEFIRTRSSLLSRDSTIWELDTKLWVSDFWFGQSLAYARALLPPPRHDAVVDRWRETHDRVRRPKLIVFIEPTPPGCVPAAENSLADRKVTLAAALRETVSQPGWGPVLRTDPSRAWEELEAAVASMR